jgi:hypothetical protein
MLFLNSWRVSSHIVRYGTKAQGKLGNIVAETLFPTNVSPCFPEWANWETVRNIGKHKMFLKFVGNIFASWEANFVSATMFPPMGKHGNI